MQIGNFTAPGRLWVLLLAVLALLAFSAPATASAEGPVRPGGSAVTRMRCASTETCDRPTMESAIASAKMNAALAYSQFLAGKVEYSRVEAAENWARALSGEPAREAGVSSPPGAVPAEAKIASIQQWYYPFQQINSNYCGPATVESMLRFLGPATSVDANGDTGAHDSLDGDPAKDQPMLASDYWLQTNRNDGTNWGDRYVPFTLNSWRGTRWYVSAATPAASGSLTKDQALAAIKYDTDRSYPVAENVLYSPRTYYPAGFWPGVVYEHWDTIYGHYQDANGAEIVQIGQVYRDKRLDASPFQDIAWDVHWTAIEQWHGLVW